MIYLSGKDALTAKWPLEGAIALSVLWYIHANSIVPNKLPNSFLESDRGRYLGE